MYHQRPYYSGKHKRRGLNVPVLADPAGRLMWASSALPGSTHELAAARERGLSHALTSAAVATFADKGYQGAGGAIGTSYRGRRLTGYPEMFNRCHAAIRAIGERAVATLKSWRILHTLRCCPRHSSTLIAAILALHHAA